MAAKPQWFQLHMYVSVRTPVEHFLSVCSVPIKGEKQGGDQRALFGFQPHHPLGHLHRFLGLSFLIWKWGHCVATQSTAPGTQLVPRWSPSLHSHQALGKSKHATGSKIVLPLCGPRLHVWNNFIH